MSHEQSGTTSFRFRNSASNAVSLLALGALIIGFTPFPAHAQQAQSQQSAPEREADVIVVTGSQIRSNQDFKSTSPIQTVDAGVIRNTAAVQLQDLFKGLTANSGSQTSNEQNALQGVSQFSLRGLGVGSTLTLINGRRAGLAPVTDETGQLFTDSNAFPVNFIERVEVLTDGASATYGSEAVAGVVNIITRKRFEGFEITADARTSTNESYQLGAAYGRALDKGRFTIFANYRTQTGNFRSDIDVIREADAKNTIDNVPIGAVFNSGTSAPGIFTRASPSATAPGGFVRVGNTLADPDCAAAGGILRGASCRYPFIDQRRLIPEEDKFQIFAQGEYNPNDKLKLYSELSFSRNEIRDAIGGTVLNRTQVAGGFLVPASHPFNYFVASGTGISYAGPAAFAAATAAGTPLTAVPLIFRGRPLGAAYDGDAAKDITTIFTNQRLVLGGDYSLNDNWTLSASYTNSNNRYTRSQPYDFDSILFQKAITDGLFNPFGTSISNPTLIGRDGRSLAGNTEDEINLFAFTIKDEGSVSQVVAEVVLSGETGFKLGGGNVAVAVGAQHRTLGYKNTPDLRRQSGRNGRDEIEPAIPYTEQSVSAFFGEASLPVSEKLQVQAALRYEDYGDRGGSTLDPKISAKFDVNDVFALRGSWGTSFQAPSIRQIAGSVGNDSVTDPRLGAAGGSFNVTVFTAGSSSLESQSAENLNLGFIVNGYHGLSIAADYFTYKYEELILPGGDPQSIVDAVEAGRLPASRVFRDAAGQLRSVFSEFLNRGNAEAAGFDINARWAPTTWPVGDLVFDASATIITKFQSSEFAGLDGKGNLKGSRNFANAFGSVPDFKLNLGATFTLDNHAFNTSARFIGEYTDDQSRLPIESQLTVDVRYTYQFEHLFGGDGSTFTIGAVNVFDVDPPTISARPIFDTEVHDPKGRQIYISLRHKF
ncbi:CirA Outer membrane receptor proteins, mostly Fe transport [Caulobacteraceae bacterium]